MRKPIRKQKDVILTYCEGEAEVMLFSFLKLQYSHGKTAFKAVNLNGFGSYEAFEKKYKKAIKGEKLKPKEEYRTVKFLFIIDNDLEDSEKIKAFLEQEGHLVQLCDPNTEGMILSILGRPQVKLIQDKDFRKKCKESFMTVFDCEAHHLKEKN